MDAHYEFAHFALRGRFLSDPNGTIRALLTGNGRGLLSILIEFLESPDRRTLRTNQFTVHPCAIGELPCVVVQMPPPLQGAEAYMIAMFEGRAHPSRSHYPADRQVHYFTLERAVESGPGSHPSVFCAWDERTHYYFGEGPRPTLEAFLSKLREITATGET